MDTTRYAKATSKPRPCLPSLQRSRRTRVAAPGRARAVSLDEVSDRSLSRDDLVWMTHHATGIERGDRRHLPMSFAQRQAAQFPDWVVVSEVSEQVKVLTSHTCCQC